MKLNSIAKAIASGLYAALTMLYALTAVAGVQLHAHEYVAIALAFLGGLGLTYSVPNSPAPPAA